MNKILVNPSEIEWNDDDLKNYYYHLLKRRNKFTALFAFCIFIVVLGFIFIDSKLMLYSFKYLIAIFFILNMICQSYITDLIKKLICIQNYYQEDYNNYQLINEKKNFITDMIWLFFIILIIIL